MTKTQGVDVSSLLVNYGFFSHGDVTLAQSYIVHISLFEAFLIFQNNVLKLYVNIVNHNDGEI